MASMSIPNVVPDLLSETAERHGARLALASDDELMTFAELELRANRFARSLMRHGIGRGERVALWLPRSAEAVVALWGAMKAGAAYVPIDPAAPPARAAAVARDCEVAAVVTLAARAEELEAAFGDNAPIRAAWFAESDGGGRQRFAGRPAIAWRELDAEPAARPAQAVDPEDLAQILYTSGSTGAPKGVMVPHRSLLAYVRWISDTFALSLEDRVPGCSPLHFGISSFEQFSTVHAGATVYPVAPRTAAFPAAIARTWSAQRLTVWYAVPSLLTMLVTRGELAGCDLSPLRLVIFTGEVFAAKHLRELMRHAPHARFVSLYGRTETKICAWHEFGKPPADDERPPLGRPCAESIALVLDERGRPVGDGQTGELWLGGPSLMRGYWKLPAQTAESMRTIEVAPGRRTLICRTGDLVRWGPDGVLEFVGRRDHQIKLRGYRVELGEVESALGRNDAVEQAVALVVAGGDGRQRLAAAVALRSGAAADEAALKRHCAALLPSYMIPEVIEFHSRLPLNSNGKIDRSALMESAATRMEATR
jgi:amino acid adenylation domain-containing protein